MSKDDFLGTQLSPQEEVGQCPLESPQGGRSFPRPRADGCLEGLVSMGHLLTDGGRTKGFLLGRPGPSWPGPSCGRTAPPGTAGSLSHSWPFDHCCLDGMSLDTCSLVPGKAHSEVYSCQGTCGSIFSALGLSPQQTRVGEELCLHTGPPEGSEAVLCCGDSHSESPASIANGLPRAGTAGRLPPGPPAPERMSTAREECLARQ